MRRCLATLTDEIIDWQSRGGQVEGGTVLPSLNLMLTTELTMRLVDQSVYDQHDQRTRMRE